MMLISTLTLVKTLVQMYGDVLFAAPCDQTVKAMAKTTDTPIYYYLYAHPGNTLHTLQ
jgi:hypothetical protein